MNRRSVLGTILAAAIGATFAGSASGQGASAQQPAWPTKPVRWIVPWGAGGAADVLARNVTQKLSERWGQQVIVDNKPGGNTIVAAQEAMRAAPDGYTLFMPIAATLTTNPFMYSKLPYDPARDFTPIGFIANLPLILLASNGAPAKTLPELIELAKKSPDTVTLGTAAGSQLQAEQWMRDWGVKFRLIMYKSGIDTTKALLASEIDLAIDAVPGNVGHIKAGKMKGLAVTAARRMPMVADVPTLDELNLKHTEPPIWHALVGPAGLSSALQSKIYADLQAVLAIPELRDKLVNEMGFEMLPPMGGQELMSKVARESAVVAPLVKELGLKVD